MQKAVSAVSLLAIAAIACLTPSVAATPDLWAGQVTEQDDYVPANPIYNVRTSCTSTAAVAVLVHTDSGWSFYTENDCIGYDVRFSNDECETDADDVLNCYYSDEVAQHWLTFTPEGDITVEHLSHGPFAGDHYVIEGNLSRVG